MTLTHFATRVNTASDRSSLYKVASPVQSQLFVHFRSHTVKMGKSDISTAELILIFSLVIDISRYFHCRVWITPDVSIHLTSLNVPHFRNSNAYNSIIYERKHIVWVFIFLVRALGTMWYQNCLCFQKMFGFCIFTACFVNRKMPVYCIK